MLLTIKDTRKCSYIEKCGVVGKHKVFAISESLVIEVCSHVVRNRHNKCGYLGKVALVTLCGVKKLKFDHVTIIAAEKKNVKSAREINFRPTPRASFVYRKEI